MEISLIFLSVSVLAVSHAATVRHDMNVFDSKGGHRQAEFQVTKPTVFEGSSVRSIQDDVRVTQMNLQSNHIEGSGIRDDKLSHQSQIQSQFHSQDHLVTGTPLSQDLSRDQSLLHSQRHTLPATTISASQSANDQFGDLSFQQQFNRDNLRMSNQQQPFDDKQKEEQQFYNRQQAPGPVQQQQFYNDRDLSTVEQQQFYNDGQQSPVQQQFHNPRQQSPVQQQFHDSRQQSPVQQQFHDSRQQRQSQPQFYNNVQTIGVENQHISPQSQMQIVSAHQSQNRNDKQRILSQDASTQIQSRGLRGDLQLSAFDNREHPLTLPRSTSVHSASVVVSGLKNLPVLPAMVYNAGSLPSTHAIAIGRDSWYQGGASVRQHLQTPYVRYVYSHIL